MCVCCMHKSHLVSLQVMKLPRVTPVMKMRIKAVKELMEETPGMEATANEEKLLICEHRVVETQPLNHIFSEQREVSLT